MKLHSKKVLLTGASGGIGRAVAISLARQGARLLLAGRDMAALEKQKVAMAGADVSIELVELDLASIELSEQVDQLILKHPDVDVLINCAGVNLFKACDAMSSEQISQMLDVNLKAVLVLTSALLPLLKRRPQAAVVNVGSTFGSIAYPGFAAYSASKFGVRGYTEALRRELAGSNVQVFYLAPRATKTTMNERAVLEMNQELGNAMDDPAWVADQLVKAIERDRFKLFLGWPEKLFVVINSVFSVLVDRALIKQLPTIQTYLKREI
ncbi:SDR family oxidoreductase [Ketobacter alkanivorans]|uniref:Short chain dehydrogenase n=1 Tax=Ketobacter alkanivorans TaxID=1917421 RepID=A0A2K9LS84_9GAMM|nr:SDR family oxidoreductase [Ketobacter alkanivorans]AUM14305.1 short chain dehydrogenase [Ketobacter alkanivorans]